MSETILQKMERLAMGGYVSSDSSSEEDYYASGGSSGAGAIIQSGATNRGAQNIGKSVFEGRRSPMSTTIVPGRRAISGLILVGDTHIREGDEPSYLEAESTKSEPKNADPEIPDIPRRRSSVGSDYDFEAPDFPTPDDVAHEIEVSEDSDEEVVVQAPPPVQKRGPGKPKKTDAQRLVKEADVPPILGKRICHPPVRPWLLEKLEYNYEEGSVKVVKWTKSGSSEVPTGKNKNANSRKTAGPSRKGDKTKKTKKN
ncbi:hypothetical protein L5515_007005 [Caenorhabditis briggsae]|uniref:Uncharacterized protein n=1 Tax=Caenorhabditis briggsae TaxID=6238 RepID=A0AAE9F3Z7_CAEBR|nr:hypothetical protein L5515_007005 [Caenorhabditis briggsae]